MKCAVQEQEDQEHRHWHDDRQPLRRSLKVFELSTPAQRDSQEGRLELFVDCGLSLGDETGDIAAAYVDSDDCPVLYVFTLNLVGPFLLGDFGEIFERNRPTLRIDDPDRADLVGIVAPRLREADSQRVPLVFIEHGAHRCASKGGH